MRGARGIGRGGGGRAEQMLLKGSLARRLLLLLLRYVRAALLRAVHRVRARELKRVALGRDLELGKGHKEEAAERRAEEGAVNALEAAVGRRVDVQARGAEELDRVDARLVVAADGQDLGLVAEDARAGAEVEEVVLLRHLLDALARGDVALVDEAVEELGGALDDAGVRGDAVVLFGAAGGVGRVDELIAVLVAHDVGRGLRSGLFLFIIVFVLILFGLDVEDHLQRFFVHGHLGLEAGQVEVIFDEVFRHFGKVFMAEQGAEGGDPGFGRGGVARGGHGVGEGGGVVGGAVARGGGRGRTVDAVAREGGGAWREGEGLEGGDEVGVLRVGCR